MGLKPAFPPTGLALALKVSIHFKIYLDLLHLPNILQLSLQSLWLHSWHKIVFEIIRRARMLLFSSSTELSNMRGEHAGHTP